MLPKKYEPNLPHGGATIKDQKSDFGKKMLLRPSRVGLSSKLAITH